MKIIREKKTGIGEEKRWEKVKEEKKIPILVDLKSDERIHLCYHDEKNPTSCRVIP